MKKSERATVFEGVLHEAGLVILDKDKELKVILAAMLAGGHVLIEDVPGVGKTTLAQTLTRLLGLRMSRIQMTNDLMPADILGTSVFDRNQSEFRFREGPVFANVLLADELNRASPRTQSALLQAMEEGEISVDGQSYALPRPFLVLATQNPHSHVGTHPLPESQIDRFMIAIKLDYATAKSELKIFSGYDPREALAGLSAKISVEDFREAQDEVRKIMVTEKLSEYVGQLVQRSRGDSQKYTPLSTRSGLALIKLAKAQAFLEGLSYVNPDLIKGLAPFVFAPRLKGSQALAAGFQKAQTLVEETGVPI